MGYYTNYTLEYTLPEKEEDSLVSEFIQNCKKANIEIPPQLKITGLPLEHSLIEWLELEYSLPDYDGGLIQFLNNSINLKWYDHEKHLLETSKKFPTILFVLTGEGEEPGDVWKKYFLGGKIQRAKGNIVFESFDESKLGDP